MYTSNALIVGTFHIVKTAISSPSELTEIKTISISSKDLLKYYKSMLYILQLNLVNQNIDLLDFILKIAYDY